jgi:alpha-tubulin suppressor-like RCC1 family protein
MLISGTQISGSLFYAPAEPTSNAGQLWITGSNGSGQLGDNTITRRSSPVQTVSAGSTWLSMAGGDSHTLGIKTDGTLWAWGSNDVGQLADNTRTNRSSPVQSYDGGTNWSQVASSRGTCGAVKSDGTLWMWGFARDGSLGDGTATNKSSPVQTVAGGTNWTYVQAGYASGGLKSDNTLWMWGQNSYGQIGDGTITNRSSPVQIGGAVWRSFATAENNSAAIRTDGTLWVWGKNYLGALGTNNAARYSSPVQTVAGGSNWSQVDVASNFMAAIKTDGTLWSWGHNSGGRLGDNTTTNRSSPVQVSGGGTNWSKLSVGGSQTSAIKADGTLWSWGANYNGQLGDNSLVDKSTPIQIGNLTGWKNVGVSKMGYQFFAILGSADPKASLIEYLVVAGGGGGGGGNGGGGGGGGGLRTGNLNVTSGSPITVTIGSGGVNRASGSASEFGSVTANAGGSGGDNGQAPVNGGSGGGGGGAGTLTTPSAYATGAFGIYPGSSYSSGTRQGYDGGNGQTDTANDRRPAGGGGGAGGAGSNSTLLTGGNGGIGAYSSITGLGAIYAGGGGGGVYRNATSAGTGGTGGGGNGGFTISGQVNGGNGTVNTGGGGGGGGEGTYPTGGGTGGSGVIIIRYSNIYPDATSTTGSPTLTNLNGYKIYKWTSSGSITF